MSFLMDDLLRDVNNMMTADTPAVVTTGFPRYCFPPVVTTKSHERGRLSHSANIGITMTQSEAEHTNKYHDYMWDR